MYKYVTKVEYKPVREEIEKMIHKVQKIVKKSYGITFQYQLISSGKRHLITQEEGGNKGFDFDYNLVIDSSFKEKKYSAKIIKKRFMDAFSKAVKDTKFVAPKDSTSAITIKKIDKKHSNILHSCDFAIIYYENNKKNGYFYLKNFKNQNKYSFEFRCLSRDINVKLNNICNKTQGWNKIRDKYIVLKNNNNDINKHSFMLYLEAVNDVWNEIQ